MKKKAIRVEYRKDSGSFPKWLKYEVTILSEDGTIEKIPAYGKDLQDALSRVVHDERIENIQNKTNLIPYWTWPLLYFIGMLFISIWTVSYNEPLFIVSGLVGTVIFIFSLNKLTKKINTDLKH